MEMRDQLHSVGHGEVSSCHIAPSIFRLLLKNTLTVVLGMVIVNEIDQCIGNVGSLRTHHISYASVGHNLGKSAHIGHQHRTLEMIGNLRDATLRGTLVGLGHEVGSGKEIAHLVGRDELLAPYDMLRKVQATFKLFVALGIAVELARNDELHLLAPQTSIGKCLQQEVEPLIVTDKPEEKDIAVVAVEPEMLNGFGSLNLCTEVVVQRVWSQHKGFTLAVEATGIIQHRLRHGHIATNRIDHIACKGAVADTVLVWYYIIEQGHHLDVPSLTAATDYSGYRTQAGSQERQPEAYHHQVGMLATD